MNLLALQRGLRDHIVHGANDVAAQIRADPTPRLAVYHNAYRMQLLACLRDRYEKTWSWLGDERFDAAALHHIEAHEPRSWTLSDYGRNFADTLAKLYPNDAEVAELAWLDEALRNAFEGADAAPFLPEVLAEVDWDRAILNLVPTLRMRSIATNCAAIWTAIANDETPPSAAILNEPVALRVWRLNLSPHFRSISILEQKALNMAVERIPFALICDALAEDPAEVDISGMIGAWLASWLQDGLLVALE
jgi:hypothetical protein